MQMKFTYSGMRTNRDMKGIMLEMQQKITVNDCLRKWDTGIIEPMIADNADSNGDMELPITVCCYSIIITFPFGRFTVIGYRVFSFLIFPIISRAVKA